MTTGPLCVFLSMGDRSWGSRKICLASLHRIRPVTVRPQNGLVRLQRRYIHRDQWFDCGFVLDALNYEYRTLDTPSLIEWKTQ